jgi:ketosteroid isomerase-like protein
MTAGGADSMGGSGGAANDAVIVALYDALGRRDGDAMAALYHPNARFQDPAFGELRGEEIGRMWRMLCERATEIEVELVWHETDEATGRAHWIARYPFTQTGRHVVNDVRAEFRFRGGLIASHDDRFDQRRWAAQALGAPGRVLGLTPFMGPLLRRRARAQLAAYRPSA